MFPCLAWNQHNQHTWSSDFCIKPEKVSVRKQHLFWKEALVFMVSGYRSDATAAVTQDRTTLHGITAVLTLFVECWRFLATDWISSLIPKRIHTAGTKVMLLTVPCTMPKVLQQFGWLKPSDWKKIVFHAQPVRNLSWKSTSSQNFSCCLQS